MTHIDERRLEHFMAAVETGSILGAAQRVHLTQPALSRSIRDLEDSIGVVLLERHPRGVRPTVYGEILLRHAQLLRNQARLAISEIEAVRDGHDGHLRIGVAPSFLRVLPAAVARLLETRPTLNVRVVEGTFDVLTAGVLAGDLEAAFTMFPAGEPDAGLTLRPLLESELVFVMGANHPLARRRKLGLGDLIEVPWAIMFRPASLVTRLRQAFLARGAAPPARFVETDSIVFVKELLHSGTFVSVLPRELVHDEVHAGHFVAKPVDQPTDSATAGVVTRTGAVLPASVDALVSAVEQEVKRMRLATPAPS